jgi:hypothetical protein
MPEELHGPTPQTEQPNQLFPVFAGTFLGLIQHIDTQNSGRASALIGISSFLIAFAVPHFESGASLSWNNTGWAIICLGAFLAVVNGILVFKPTLHDARKRLNLFYPGSYLRRLSRDEYHTQFSALLESESHLREHFAQELYDYGAVVKSSSQHLERAMMLFAIDVLAGAGILIINVILQ